MKPLKLNGAALPQPNKLQRSADLRQERIEPHRQQIASGTYSVPASDIADAILKDEQ